MAENDIYNSESKYFAFKKNIKEFLKCPKSTSKRQYYCKHAPNLDYFYRLFDYFEARDLSYIRRIRLCMTMKIICYAADQDLKSLNRTSIDRVIAVMHQAYKSPKSKSDFIRDIKYLWKILFPEKDEKGRPDETLTPYAVRHLSPKIDRSKEKLRNDRITPAEFEKIVTYFSKDPRLQAYLTLALESVGRPQELLYCRIKDVELVENYAKVWISEHGKEGCGLLQSIDSFPYLVRWLARHPQKTDKTAFLFINLETGFGKQLRPENINKHLKTALRNLGIDKKFTCYSLKRNGVTFRRLRGDSDLEIQHAARWTSAKQLKTYDMSNQEDALKIQLAKRGILNDDRYKEYHPERKKCYFCGAENGFTDKTCANPSCRRPLDREVVQKQANIFDKMQKLVEWIEHSDKVKELIEKELGL